MARRVPVVATGGVQQVEKIALSQPSGYANLNSGVGSWHWINPWWSGAMGDIQYTTQTDNCRLLVKWQYNHSHGATWRSGCVRQHMKDAFGNWQSLGNIGSTSYIEGYSTSGETAFGCCKVNPQDYGFGSSAGQVITFSQQWRGQTSGNWTKVASFSVDNESSNNGQANCSRGGWSMNIEEIPLEHFGAQNF
tara:strand:- start:61 stop:636 length:576 start_codon:yes stop_codon:yes gene_type:complete